MQIFNDLCEWLSFRATISPHLTLGFVPTMGNLHAGHASLMERSRQENDLTVVSLFINPTQFNRPDDYTHYPRTLEADLELLQKIGVDYCLLPTEQAMYLDGYRYKITENNLSQVMEGTSRPGHFDGVLTVVMKLLNIVRPKQAYFGEKDYQQYCLIRDMVNAFFMPVTINVCPTIRETSQLAYSSRNNRLTLNERQLAERFAMIFHQDKNCDDLLQELKENKINVEYLVEHDNRRFVAVTIGSVRLIDNYAMKNKE
ncbi:pantoate--beta-alanine ligase [Legionella beliardensis]|uniref:Pantothenate synthetase n=1 Tax=Legionella beliardensis TaxID=91822 RepID=A0A378I4W2_9GAMM|nr:pantoate--beta-alanine ligase [Legionella beliardensis]STX30053.1 pantoate--beta-alanine ligase [Legionella beliardensis]